jgi:nitrite reductase/ring-hydroxylating ferredoxin subunit
MCAYHCSVFRFEDGYCTEGPGKGMKLEAVALKIADDQLFIGEI